jgi:hypothetical protein
MVRCCSFAWEPEIRRDADILTEQAALPTPFGAWCRRAVAVHAPSRPRQFWRKLRLPFFRCWTVARPDVPRPFFNLTPSYMV